MFWETQWPTLKQDLFYETINFVTVGKVTLGWQGKPAWKKRFQERNGS